MSFLRFFGVIEDDLKQVEALLSRAADVPEEALAWALKGLLQAGGKRFRPALAILAARLFQDAPYGADKVNSLAASVELLHTATLIHDDFIDNSHLRRGTATLNSLWDDGVVVLAGDYLFSQAASLVMKTEDVQVLAIFARTLRRICTGELSHIFGQFGRWPANKAQYFRYIYSKTASLFATSAQCGGLLVQAPGEHTRALRDFGYSLGMAFQIVDDLLDFVGTEEELGKPTGSDLRQGMLTLPALYFLQQHPEESIPEPAALDEEEKEEWAEGLASAIAVSPAIERSRRDADFFLDRARARLALLPRSAHWDALAELAEYVLARRV